MTQIEEFIKYVQRVYLDLSEKCPGAFPPETYAEVMRALRDFSAKVHAGEAG